MSQESGVENFNILIEDLDIADQKSISKQKTLRNVLLKCRREIVTIILIILVIAMVAIGKAPPRKISVSPAYTYSSITTLI